MNVSKMVLAAIVTGSLFACQGSGSGDAPLTAAPQKDYNAMAVAMAVSVVFEIPPDLPHDCYFDANVVLNGHSVPAFQNSAVPYGSSCVVEQRLCQDGTLLGSYNYATCIVDAPASCLFNGQTIADGAQVNAFANSTVAFGQQCVQEARICHNGVLSGSYSYNSCAVDQPASCLFNGQSVATGQSVAAYLTSSVPSDQTCTLEYRTCTDGFLSGSNTFATCNVNQPASCIFNGQNVASGESVTAFVNSSVAAGASCNSEVRVCNNGVLSGSNQFASCQVSAPASCIFNGQTIPHGSSVNAFASSSVEYGQLCSGELRICENAHLSGSFQYASCDQGQAASCLFNGQTIPDGANLSAFPASTVPNGSSCKAQVRTCANGVLSGTASFASCKVSAPASCLFNGQTIISGQSVAAYQTATVKKAQRCVTETRSCNNGVLSGSYGYAACALEAPGGDNDDNNDDDDNVKVCKLVVKIKQKENTCDKMNKSQGLAFNHYKERYDCGKHVGWKHCEHYPGRHDCGKHLGWYKQSNWDDRGKNSSWYKETPGKSKRDK